MKIWFTKTSDYGHDGKMREFNTLDEAITTFMNECKEEQKHGAVELIIYCDSDTKNHGYDYIIEYYNDWRE